jgi:MoxR-like ATPase
MLKIVITYPGKDEEKLIMRENTGKTFPFPDKILAPEDILRSCEMAKDVYMDEKIEQYILDIVFATRFPSDYHLPQYANMISYGASPRASINLAKAARAYAFIRHRGFVIPEDVRAVCLDVMRHRIGLTYEAEAENITTEEIVTDILNNIEVP